MIHLLFVDYRCMIVRIICRYDTARGIIDALFGPKAHKEFPKNRRLEGSGCNSGFYPSSLGGGRSEYKHQGLDLVIERGDTVSLITKQYGTGMFMTEHKQNVDTHVTSVS